jgi:TrmH family RNA methyltransferase
LPRTSELDRLSVVLVSTRNPLNIGAAARAMGNFGFSDLRVVNPFEQSFREARSAVGASELLAKAKQYDDLAEAIADCDLVVGTTSARDREILQPLRPLAAGSRLIRKHLASGRIALLFGSEKRGLSNHDLSHCHWLMRIPTCENLPAMNLGQSVAICLYELARTRSQSGRSKKPASAASAELERITMLLLDLLTASGYTSSGSAAQAEQKVRRLIRRLSLSPDDAETLLGMLRQILWKLRASEST